MAKIFCGFTDPKDIVFSIQQKNVVGEKNIVENPECLWCTDMPEATIISHMNFGTTFAQMVMKHLQQ